MKSIKEEVNYFLGQEAPMGLTHLNYGSGKGRIGNGEAILRIAKEGEILANNPTYDFFVKENSISPNICNVFTKALVGLRKISLDKIPSKEDLKNIYLMESFFKDFISFYEKRKSVVDSKAKPLSNIDENVLKKIKIYIESLQKFSDRFSKKIPKIYVKEIIEDPIVQYFLRDHINYLDKKDKLRKYEKYLDGNDLEKKLYLLINLLDRIERKKGVISQEKDINDEICLAMSEFGNKFNAFLKKISV